MPSFKLNNNQNALNSLVRSIRGEGPHEVGFVRNPKPTTFPQAPGRFDFLSWTDAHSAWKNLGPSVSAEAIFVMRNRGVDWVHVRNIDIVWISTKHPKFRTHGLFDPEEPTEYSGSVNGSTIQTSIETKTEESSDDMLNANSEEYQTVLAAVQSHPANSEEHTGSSSSDKVPTLVETIPHEGLPNKHKRKAQSQDISKDSRSALTSSGHHAKRVRQSVEPSSELTREKIVYTWDHKQAKGKRKQPRNDCQNKAVRESSSASSTDKRSRGGFATAVDGDFETYDAKARAAKEDEEFERPKEQKGWTRSGRKREP